MGQGTHGLLYGARVPEGVILRDDDVDEGDNSRGLLDQWEEQRGGDELPYRVGIVDHCEWDYGDGTSLIGIYIAVGASGIRGVPDLDASVRVDRVDEEEAYADRLVWAREEWGRFADWYADKGSGLDAPGLWLVGLEVA